MPKIKGRRRADHNALHYKPERLAFALRASSTASSGFKLLPLYRIRTEHVNDARATLEGKDAPITLVSAYCAVPPGRPFLEWSIQQIGVKSFKLPVKGAGQSAERKDTGHRNLYLTVNGARGAISQIHLPPNCSRNPLRESGLTLPNEADGHDYFHAFLFCERAVDSAPVLEGIPKKAFHEDGWSSLRLEVYRTELIEPFAEDPDAGWLQEDDLGEVRPGAEASAGRGERHTHLIGIGEATKKLPRPTHPWDNEEEPLEPDDDAFPYLQFVVYFKSMEKLVELGIVPKPAQTTSAARSAQAPESNSDEEDEKTALAAETSHLESSQFASQSQMEDDTIPESDMDPVSDEEAPVASTSRLAPSSPPAPNRSRAESPQPLVHPDPSSPPPPMYSGLPSPAVRSSPGSRGIKRERSGSPVIAPRSANRPRTSGFGGRAPLPHSSTSSSPSSYSKPRIRRTTSPDRATTPKTRFIEGLLRQLGIAGDLQLHAAFLRDAGIEEDFRAQYEGWSRHDIDTFWRGLKDAILEVPELTLVQKVSLNSLLEKFRSFMEH